LQAFKVLPLFVSQDTNIGSLDTMDMGATDHMMKPTVLAPLSSIQSIIMPALTPPRAAAELTKNHMKREPRNCDTRLLIFRRLINFVAEQATQAVTLSGQILYQIYWPNSSYSYLC
jgi:hypothetical protein